MITKRILSLMCFRIKAMKYTFVSLYDWDYTKGQMIYTNSYSQWNYTLLSYVGLMYLFLLGMYLVENFYDENGISSPMSYLIGLGEAVLAFCACTYAIHFKRHKHAIYLLVNQIIQFHETVQGMRIRAGSCDNNGKVESGISKMVTTGFFVMCLVTLVLPFAFALCITIDFDPTHVLLLEWLEVDIKLQFKEVYSESYNNLATTFRAIFEGLLNIPDLS
ncbi:unnamed protein product [Orchesella dallaii]|uniref:Uncharacterized protein n=1 Tax=Orchesella dallaii TaxID=48710 RepID=A0ABP1QKY5_9HEXA